MTTPDTSGLLVLDKPEGITSHTAVQKVKRALGVRRAGHAGTLDPLARGVLLVGLGPATRLLEYLVGHDKAYRARVRLGVVTDTLDREGAVIASRPIPALEPCRIGEALDGLRGAIIQVPPVHSAIKVDGQPLHRRARRGEEVQVPARQVVIHRLQTLEVDLPDITLEVCCSSGTYVRSLARDLGEALGTGAALWDLVRTRSGPFRIEDALPLEELERDPAAARHRILPPGSMVHALPRVTVDEQAAAALAHGQSLPLGEHLAPGVCAVDLPGGDLVAIGKVEEYLLRPHKVLWQPA